MSGGHHRRAVRLDPPPRERPRHRGRRCPTQKVRWKSEADAALALERARFKPIGPRTPRSFYRCDRCGDWHLTSWVDGKPFEAAPPAPPAFTPRGGSA